MDDNHPQLARIEALLREGNLLRQRAIELQQESIAAQREALAQTQPLLDAQRDNLEQASRINDQALAIQRKARRIVSLIVPILLVLVAYVSYLIFFRPYA